MAIPLNKCAIHDFVKLIFFGNYFYGICAVAIYFETEIQMSVRSGEPAIYLIIFFATVLFYNYPYARNYSNGSNPRTAWYFKHHKLVIASQITFTIILIFLTVPLAMRYSRNIKKLDLQQWLLISVFPFTGALYYGSNFLSRQYSLRQVGWLKPFVIGFVWAGLATVYPILIYDILNSRSFDYSLLGILLFVKNMMFVSILAIMFDIKDYATDGRSQLNTLVVKLGLKKTIFYVLLPLPVLGLITFLSYAVTHQFSFLKMILIMIPFILLLTVGRSLKKRKSLLYYLIIIDGLLIVKAFFDILAMKVNI